MLPIKKLVLSSLFAALIALLAQISIPLPFSPVPITGQAFGIFLVGSLLEGKWLSLYTHLDVYKRQSSHRWLPASAPFRILRGSWARRFWPIAVPPGPRRM